MKKFGIVLMALCLGLTAIFAVGCTSNDDKKSQEDVPRIKVYAAPNNEKGPLLSTVKGSENEIMSVVNQMYADTKAEEKGAKKDTSKAIEAYLFELLNYDDEGNEKDSNFMYVYFIDNSVYCYYDEQQTFEDGKFYINGDTEVTQETINEMIVGASN